MTQQETQLSAATAQLSTGGVAELVVCRRRATLLSLLLLARPPFLHRLRNPWSLLDQDLELHL